MGAEYQSHHRHGFTIIEMLVVMVVIGIGLLLAGGGSRHSTVRHR